MTDNKVLRGLDELVEAARLLGTTQAKKGFGCYTAEDSRFERAMHESIAKHRAALAAMGGQGDVGWWCPACEVTVPPEHVTYNETHDTRAGGCGGDVGHNPAPQQPEARVDYSDRGQCPVCDYDGLWMLMKEDERRKRVADFVATPPAPRSVAEGWKLVPVEATEEMSFAGDQILQDELCNSEQVWAAMLAAAPEPGEGR